MQVSLLVNELEEPLQSIFTSSTFHTQESERSTAKSRSFDFQSDFLSTLEQILYEKLSWLVR